MEDLEYKGYEDYLIERVENPTYNWIIYRFDFGFGYGACVKLDLNKNISDLFVLRFEDGVYDQAYDTPITNGQSHVTCVSSEQVLEYFDKIMSYSHEDEEKELDSFEQPVMVIGDKKLPISPEVFEIIQDLQKKNKKLKRKNKKLRHKINKMQNTQNKIKELPEGTIDDTEIEYELYNTKEGKMGEVSFSNGVIVGGLEGSTSKPSIDISIPRDINPEIINRFAQKLNELKENNKLKELSDDEE
jgi:hypothetical protein